MPRWLPAVGALSAVSTDAAAHVAVRLFFRTQRGRAQDGERDVLRAATPFEVPHEGEKIAAWSWGRGARTVLLVHGWNGRGTQLGAFVEPLLASGHRVVAFDHVGHGASSGSSASLVAMAGAVATLADVVGASRVIGHSLGAGAAVLAMAEGLDLERVVLIAPPLAPDPWLEKMATALRLPPETALRAKTLIEQRVGRTFAELHLPSLAAKLRRPALIVHDRDDREIPIDAAEALSYAWAGSRLLVTAGLGHTRILRSPGVLEAARRFVE